jgi:hypothetical protein
MRSFRRSLGFSAFLVLCVVMLAPAAAAQDDDGPDTDDHIVLNGRLVVPAGESVRYAVIVNGNATIDGAVRKTLIVFNGRTEISGTVGEDLIVFNGDVILRSGARVGGDVISLEDPQIEDGVTVEGRVTDLARRWNFYEVTFVGRFAWWLGYTASTLVLGLVLLLLAPGIDPASVRALRERLGGTIGFGLLAFVVIPIVAVLLLVTIVGIPLGLFLLLALGLLYSIGYVVGTLAFGRLIVKESTSRFTAFLAGWVVFRLIALAPFAGGLAWTVATVVGFGTLLVAARARPSEIEPVSPAQPVVPPPPVPS